MLCLGVGSYYSYLTIRVQTENDAANFHRQHFAIAQNHLKQLDQEWVRLVQGLSQSSSIQTLLLTSNRGQKARARQLATNFKNPFNDLLKSSVNHLDTVRVTNVRGEDVVVVSQRVDWNDVADHSSEANFQRVLFASQGNIAPIDIRKVGKHVYLERSVAVYQDQERLGMVTLSSNIERLLQHYYAWPGQAIQQYKILKQGDSYVALLGQTVLAVPPSIISLEQEPFFKQEAKFWFGEKNSVLGLTVLQQTPANLEADVIADHHASFIAVAILLSVILLIVSGLFIFRLRRVSTENSSEREFIRNRSKFLANISHEIRTPLSGMLGMVSLVKDTHLSKEQLSLISSIQRSGEWLFQLLNDFLDYSKIDAGQLELEYIDFDLRTMISDVIELMSIQAFNKGLELTSLISAEMPERINSDPTRIRQILLNLLGNAVKFTDKGDVALGISQFENKQGEAFLRFDVIDTGVGLNVDDVSLLFKPYQQSSASVSRQYGGTGLGLTIAKQLLDALGGEISAEENAHGGSTFWFCIPLKVAQVAQPVEDAVSLDGLRVLVAGEVAVNRRTIMSTVSQWNINASEVEVIADAFEKMEQAKQHATPYHVCIIDISLSFSNENAFQLAEKIRKSHLSKHTRIVILTADGQPGDGLKARKIGVQAYLSKPINRSQLQRCLQQVCQIKKLDESSLITRHSLQEEAARKTYRILVVEDDEVSQKVLLGLLAKLGYQADFVNNGKQALQTLKQRAYDLVFLDNSLPDMDGLEVTKTVREKQKKWLKKLDHEKPYLIIGVSANSEAGFKQKCLQAGMDEYLSKPVSLEDLDAVIGQWLPALKKSA